MGQDLLTPFQRDLLNAAPGISGLTDQFYLTGGTALAVFHLHHRESEDFDFFSVGEVDHTRANRVAGALAKAIGASVGESTQTFNRNIYKFLRDGQPLKVEFNYYPHEPIERYVKFGKLRIDSLYDIAVNKTFTIYQHARARDYVDLFLAMRKLKVGLETLVRDAHNKFDTHTDILQMGAKLAKVVQVKDYPRMRIDFSFKEMEKFFLSEARKLKGRILK